MAAAAQALDAGFRQCSPTDELAEAPVGLLEAAVWRSTSGRLRMPSSPWLQIGSRRPDGACEAGAHGSRAGESNRIFADADLADPEAGF
jgi:hypothetical protein